LTEQEKKFLIEKEDLRNRTIEEMRTDFEREILRWKERLNLTENARMELERKLTDYEEKNRSNEISIQ
jgi:hypothetical protein